MWIATDINNLSNISCFPSIHCGHSNIHTYTDTSKLLIIKIYTYPNKVNQTFIFSISRRDRASTVPYYSPSVRWLRRKTNVGVGVRMSPVRGKERLLSLSPGTLASAGRVSVPSGRSFRRGRGGRSRGRGRSRSSFRGSFWGVCNAATVQVLGCHQDIL